MGNISLPSSLTDLAKYCDCLQPIEQFHHEKQATQKSEKSQSEQKQQDTPKKQPRRQLKQNIDEVLIEEPQPAKYYKPFPLQSSMKRRSQLLIKPSSYAPQKMEQISQLSEEPQPRRKNNLQIIEIDKDEDIKANNMLKLYNPLFHSHSDLKPRSSPPPLMKTTINHEQQQINNVQISEINDVPSHDSQPQYFLSDSDKKQYERQQAMNKSSYP